METDLILQQPVTVDGAELLLLFHGVGSSAQDLAPLGQALAAARPQAWVVSAHSPRWAAPRRSIASPAWVTASTHGWSIRSCNGDLGDLDDA